MYHCTYHDTNDEIMTFESKHTNYFGENNLTTVLSFVSKIVEIMMMIFGIFSFFLIFFHSISFFFEPKVEKIFIGVFKRKKASALRF